MLKVIPRQIIPNSIMTIPEEPNGIHQWIIDNKPQAEATKDSAAIRQGEISRDVSPPIHKEMHLQGPNLRGHQMIPMDQEDQEDPEDPEAHLAGAVHLAAAGAARQATHHPEADIMGTIPVPQARDQMEDPSTKDMTIIDLIVSKMCWQPQQSCSTDRRDYNRDQG